jgi:hypothetical protein
MSGGDYVIDLQHRNRCANGETAMAILIKALAVVAAGAVFALSASAQSARETSGTLAGGGSMPAQTTNLFLLEDLENTSRTKKLAERDVNALQAVANWTKTFVARPHKGLGRAGPVCPFVPPALERKILWLAPERIADRSVPEIVQLMNGYKKLLLSAQPIDGDDANYEVIVVVFTDLPADRAQGVFGDVLQHLAVPSYVEDGILFGPFYEGNEGTAIYNPGFRPFQSPVPFLFVRHEVISDWKFFLDKEDWLNFWARRYGEAGVQALAEELRRLPWRARRD